MNFKDFLNICWNLLGAYLIVASVVIAHDYSKHPEKYVAIDKRPQQQLEETKDKYFGQGVVTIPDWQYNASTIAECKPMQNWMDIFNKWLKPAFWLTILLVFVSFGYRHREKIVSFLEKAEETNKPEEKI